MASLDTNEFVEEMTVFLRNQNIISVADRGMTTQTDEYNGDTIEVDFQINRTNVKNVRSVTVGGTPQSFGTDYLVNYADGNGKTTVTFSSAPGSGTDNVDIQYDYGDNEKVKTDFDFDDMNLNSFPVISWDEISQSSLPGGLGGASNMTSTVLSINIYETSKRNLRTRIKSIKDAILSNETSFFYVTWIRYLGKGPLLLPPFEKTKNKIFQRNVDLIIPVEFEDA